MGKIGRNDPCPCGSGKKYKRCCLEKGAAGPAAEIHETESFTSEERASAIQKLISHASGPEFETDREIGISLFWGGCLEGRSDEEIRMVEELQQTEINFNTWFLYDMDLEDEKTILDLFLVQEGVLLSPGERTYLQKAARTHFRLYEVEQVEIDKGFRLKGLWTGESLQVMERAATHSFVQWDLMATRLMDLGGNRWVSDGGIYNYPPRAKKPLLKALRAEHKRYQRNLPGRGDTAFFKRIGILFNQWWLDWVVFPPLPKMITPEGNEMVFTKALFDVQDSTRLVESLERHPDLEGLEPGVYAWREEMPEGHRSLGTLTIKENRLILETVSKERAERGRSLLEAVAGSSVRYRVTEYQEPAQAIKAREGKEIKVKNPIPEEIQAPIIKKFLDDHYRKWLDEELSALSHRTPRHAVTLKTFQPKVIDLLKEMENMEAHAAERGKTPYDFGWLWRELGLEKERGK
ncbi:MAG: YecA family protein [Nitrospiria bacterium]